MHRLVVFATLLFSAYLLSGNGFYVWQQQWTDAVEAAVIDELTAGTHDLYILGGELEYVNGAARWRLPSVPEWHWRKTRVTAVLRLPVRALDDLEISAAKTIARAVALKVNRIQLDVDVPERAIVRYAELLEKLRRDWPESAGKLHLGVTLLPCHLPHSEVSMVLKAIDEPIIQLHGIDAPKSCSDHWALMNRSTAFGALRAARKLDSRFKMALPSYAYVLTFNADGSFRRLYAEGLPDDFTLPQGTIRALAAPDLELIHEILSSPLCLPTIWFRLPVSGADRWCFSRETLASLERGEKPTPSIEFLVQPGARAEVANIVARYHHQIPSAGAFAVVEWGSEKAIGEFFPLNGCRVEGDEAYGRLPRVISIPPFACGESRVIAKVIASIDWRKVSIQQARSKPILPPRIKPLANKPSAP